MYWQNCTFVLTTFLFNAGDERRVYACFCLVYFFFANCQGNSCQSTVVFSISKFYIYITYILIYKLYIYIFLGKKPQTNTLWFSYSAVGIYLQRTYYENCNFHVKWETCSSNSYM